ncbi:NAC domain-containing protein [Psidium guajava]|nr:NAC domain-containing protein [Psidium guajava]
MGRGRIFPVEFSVGIPSLSPRTFPTPSFAPEFTVLGHPIKSTASILVHALSWSSSVVRFSSLRNRRRNRSLSPLGFFDGDGALGELAEDVLCSLHRIAMEPPSLIVQVSQGLNFNSTSNTEYTHGVVIRFRSIEAF